MRSVLERVKSRVREGAGEVRVLSCKRARSGDGSRELQEVRKRTRLQSLGEEHYSGGNSMC